MVVEAVDAVAVVVIVLVALVVVVLAAVVVEVDSEVRWSYSDIIRVLLHSKLLLTNIFYGVLKYLIFK